MNNNIYPSEIKQIKERFFRQAYETLYDNLFMLNGHETMSAFNHSINDSGYCPTITTRCEGFKNAILVIIKDVKYDKKMPNV